VALAVRVVAATAVLAVAVIALFWDGLAWTWTTWMVTPEYSHGVIIPFIAAFLSGSARIASSASP